MLDEAQFTLMGFIKGPVCRGQVALDVIQERFWIAFSTRMPRGSSKRRACSPRASELDMPGGRRQQRDCAAVVRLREQAPRLRAARRATSCVASTHERGGLGLDAIWDGDGKNDNAALTVFRH